MATKVSVNLPDKLYQRTQRFARLHQQDTDAAISMLIERALAAEDTADEIVDSPEPDDAVARERNAYHAMHAMLKEQYLGKYVAIYQGKLIDLDDDPATLVGRTDKEYPGEFVLITRVGVEPMRTIQIRSPRLIRD
ncbi:MAG: hypothetical protein KDE31_25265 [Caldilineaceae bacterium]|nr:hypothetical protein [Caldilineaceae bacterium]